MISLLWLGTWLSQKYYLLQHHEAKKSSPCMQLERLIYIVHKIPNKKHVYFLWYGGISH